MSLKKIGSISAPINHYNSGGKQHTFYQPCGSLMKNTQTNEVLVFIEKWFNPMSCINSHNPDKGSVCLNVKLEDNVTRTSAPEPVPVAKENPQSRPTSIKNGLANKQTKIKQRPSPEALRAAMELINTDMLMKQNEGKDGKHIDLPFDSDLE